MIRKRCIDCKNFIGIGESYCFCSKTATPLPTNRKKILYQYNWCGEFEKKEEKK